MGLFGLVVAWGALLGMVGLVVLLNLWAWSKVAALLAGAP